MEETHLQGLSRRMWAVLIVLVLLTVTTSILLHRVIKGHEDVGALVNLSGKQRMLSQRVVMLANRLLHVQSTERPAIRQSMLDAIQQMATHHQALLHGDQSLAIAGPPPAKAISLLMGPDGDLDRQVKSFLLAAREVAGLTDADLRDDDRRLDFLHDAASQVLLKNLDQMVAIYQREGENQTGFLEQVHLTATLLTLATLVISWMAILAPVLKRLRQAMEDHRHQEMEIRKLSQATDQSPSGVIITNAQGVVEYANPHFCEMTGYSPAEILGSKPNQLKSGYTNPQVYNELWETVLAGQDWKGTFINRKKSGELYHDHTTIRPIADGDGQLSHFLAIKQDITEQLRMEQALRDAKNQADAANRAKSEFLASMSHELRTPMNAILGFAQLLAEDPKTPLNREQSECVIHILKGGRHLLGLINEVLDLSRIEAGKMTVSMDHVKLQDVLTECLPFCKAQAERRGITIVDRFGALARVYVMADFARLKQVLLNLISNAIKYNRPQGTVLVEAMALEGDNIRIRIKDTGPGIPPDQQQDIFQPFQRLGAELSGIEGTGIGLTITKRLVELMDGHIGFESHPGQGTTFWVDLVKSYKTGEQAAMAMPPPPPAPWAKLLTLPGGAILYVEDNPANLRLLEKAIARIPHFSFLSTHNGDLGLEMAKVHHPSVIILDINLPGKNGYQVLQSLRDDQETRPIPLVALTSHARPEDIAHGLEAGFDAYLTKPLDLDLFYQTLFVVLQKHTTTN